MNAFKTTLAESKWLQRVRDFDSAEGTQIDSVPNVPLNQLFRNCSYNLCAGWKSLHMPRPELLIPHEVAILGGGPSLNNHISDLLALKERFVPFVTMNGSYHWCLQNGFAPQIQMISDARPFNVRFVQPVHPMCLYFIATQCDPGVLEDLPKDSTFLWRRELIVGGSTVGLCAVPLLALLGVKKFHLFGFDSCLTEQEHHAYSQPENSGEQVLDIVIDGDKTFHCFLWMALQAEEFLELCPYWPEFKVYGDGLIATLLKEQDT